MHWTSPRSTSPKRDRCRTGAAARRDHQRCAAEMHALRDRLHGALGARGRRVPRPAHAAAGRSRTAARPGRADPHRPLQRRLRVAAAARPHRRRVRGDGRPVFPQPPRRHRPGDRPHPCRAAPPRCRPARRRRRDPRHRQHRAGRAGAIPGPGRGRDRHRRRQRALAQRDPRPQPAPAAGGGRGAGAAEDQRRRRADRRRRQRTGGAGARPGRPARASRARARARARAARSSIACAASRPGPATASTSSCTPTPNRARTWPKHTRWARPASACTAPSSCSCNASNCPTRKNSSASTAMSCSA